MKVLVTGHKGYVGSVVVPYLIEQGHELSGMDIDLYRRCSYGTEPVQVESLEKDVRDAAPEDFAGLDAVVHLAALSNDPLGDMNPQITWDINHLGAVRVAQAAKEAGVPLFVMASTCSNYGAGGDAPVDETAELHPLTAYAQSKVQAEIDITAMADETFSPVFLRFATAYGLSPRLRFDIVLNNLAAWAFTTGKIMLKSDGTPWRPLIHVEDMARAFAAVLSVPRERVSGEAFNVSPPDENYRIRQLAEIIGEEFPGCELSFADGASADSRNYRVSTAKIQERIPEFQPTWNARKGAGQLLAAYGEHGLELQQFEGPMYNRIQHVKMLLSEGALDSELRWTAARSSGE